MLICHEGWRKHTVHGFLEVDVTKSRNIIRSYREKTGDRVSFTSWLVKCTADAVSQHDELNCYRHGRKKIVYFEDVDVGVPVERTVDDEKKIWFMF